MECRVEGCQRPLKYKAKRLCQTHYHRLYRGKPIGTAEAQQRRYEGDACGVPGCDRLRVNGAPMCSMHEARVRRHGSPEIVLSPAPRPGEANGNWSTVPTYTAVHQRLRRYRGRARDHICPCGERAQHWSYDHTDPNEMRSDDGAFSSDLSRYVARCVPCHKALDLERIK